MSTDGEVVNYQVGDCIRIASITFRIVKLELAYNNTPRAELSALSAELERGETHPPPNQDWLRIAERPKKTVTLNEAHKEVR